MIFFSSISNTIVLKISTYDIHSESLRDTDTGGVDTITASNCDDDNEDDDNDDDEDDPNEETLGDEIRKGAYGSMCLIGITSSIAYK